MVVCVNDNLRIGSGMNCGIAVGTTAAMFCALVAANDVSSVALVALDPPLNIVIEVVAPGINAATPNTFQSPAGNVIEATFAETLVVNATELP